MRIHGDYHSRGLESVYKTLWRTPGKNINRVISYLLAGQLDGVSRAVLSYISDLRARELDVDFPRCRTSDGISHILLMYTFAGNKAWLYLYDLSRSRIGVLKVRPGLSFDRIIKRASYGTLLKFCVNAGSVRYIVGLNKIRKYGRVRMKVRGLKRTRIELPCITREDFETHRGFYDCILGQLGIAPPLLVQLPMVKDVEGMQVVETEVGIVLAIKWGSGEVRTAIVPLRHIHRISFASFDDMLLSIQRLAGDAIQHFVITGSIDCISLKEYMEQKQIKLFIEYLAKYAFGPSLDDVKAAGLQETYIDILRDLRHVHSGLEACITNALRSPAITVKKAIAGLIEIGAECVLATLPILPKPDVVETYELGFLKRLSRAGLCLKQLAYGLR
jgi:hypothetical protein